MNQDTFETVNQHSFQNILQKKENKERTVKLFFDMKMTRL